MFTRLRLGGGSLIVVASAVLAAACSAPAGPPPAPAPTTTPDPVAACVTKLSHWADVQLHGGPDSGLDYQEMGLSGAENEALRQIVQRAGPGGENAVEPLARDACRQLAAHPDATPWA
jgi:hypothetical protein